MVHTKGASFCSKALNGSDKKNTCVANPQENLQQHSTERTPKDPWDYLIATYNLHLNGVRWLMTRVTPIALDFFTSPAAGEANRW